MTLGLRKPSMADKQKRARKQAPNQVWLNAIMSTTRAATDPHGAADYVIYDTGPTKPGAGHVATSMISVNAYLPNDDMRMAFPSTGGGGGNHLQFSQPVTSPMPLLTPLPGSNSLVDMYELQLQSEDSRLVEAISAAMREMVIEQECKFIANGQCHLCGNNSGKLMPVVNFCPEFDASHSLCRQHLQSMHKACWDELGIRPRHDMTGVRRMFRCLMCCRSCPCARCHVDKEREVEHYKQWLLARVRGEPEVIRDEAERGPSPVEFHQVPAAAQHPMEGGIMYSDPVVVENAAEKKRKRDAVATRNYDDHALEAKAQPRDAPRPAPRRQPSPVPADRLPVDSDGKAVSLATRAPKRAAKATRGLPDPNNRRPGENQGNDTSVSAAKDGNNVRAVAEPKDADNRGARAPTPISSVSSSREHSPSRGVIPLRPRPSRTSTTHEEQPQQHPPPPPQQQQQKQQQQQQQQPQPTPPTNAEPMVTVALPPQPFLPAVASSVSAVEHPPTVVPPPVRAATPPSASPPVVQTSDPHSSVAPQVAQPIDTTPIESSLAPTTIAVQPMAEAPDPSVSVDSESTLTDEAGEEPSAQTRKPKRKRDMYTSHMPVAEGSGAKSPTRLSETKKTADANSDNEEKQKRHARSEHGRKHKDDDAEGEKRTTSSTRSRDHEANQNSLYRRKAPTPLSVEKKSTKASQASPSPRPKTSTRAKATTEGRGRKKGSPAVGRKRKSDRVNIAVDKKAQKAGKTSRRGPGRPRTRKIEDDDEHQRASDTTEEEEAEQPADDGDDSEIDTNLDYCEVCSGAGDLVCCDFCPRSFHLKCLKLREEDLPEGDWQCKECKKPSAFSATMAAVVQKATVPAKCHQIIKSMKAHPFAKQFLEPVTDVPNYNTIVRYPMDLKKIEKKLRQDRYMVEEPNNPGKKFNLEAFARDVRLIWSNCKLFNDDGSGIVRAADELSNGFEELYQHVKNFGISTSTTYNAHQGASSATKVVSASAAVVSKLTDEKSAPRNAMGPPVQAEETRFKTATNTSSTSEEPAAVLHDSKTSTTSVPEVPGGSAAVTTTKPDVSTSEFQNVSKHANPQPTSAVSPADPTASSDPVKSNGGAASSEVPKPSSVAAVV